MKPRVEFDTFGYSVDYLKDGKYLGSVRLEEKDRENFGYSGREEKTLKENTEIKKGTKKVTLKAGLTVHTELFPLNGRIKKS